LDAIQHSARVAEIANAGIVDSDKAVSELSRTVTLLVDKLTAKETAAPPTAAPVVAAVASDRGGNDRQQDRQRYAPSYNRPRGQGSRQSSQPRQQYQRRFDYQSQDRMVPGQGPAPCGNCLNFHEANRCPALHKRALIANATIILQRPVARAYSGSRDTIFNFRKRDSGLPPEEQAPRSH
jgi:hypothetical protein